MESPTAIVINELLIQTTCMNLKIIMQSARSRQKGAVSLWFHVYKTVENVTSDRDYIGDCVGRRGGDGNGKEGGNYKAAKESLGVMDMFIILLVIMVSYMPKLSKLYDLSMCIYVWNKAVKIKPTWKLVNVVWFWRTKSTCTQNRALHLYVSDTDKSKNCNNCRLIHVVNDPVKVSIKQNTAMHASGAHSVC